MESPEDEPFLSDVAEAIADGRPIAWADLSRRAGTSLRADLVKQLQVLEALAALHRSHDSTGAGPTVPAPPAPAPLGTWGGFELLEQIGQGSFGVVYRARDVRLDREVALKLLTPTTGANLAGNSAVAEGRLLARLRHPNVITVYGADVIDGVVGISMELLAGRTLEQELVDRGPISAREAALVGLDLCRALAAVHRAGLVHRDVKPHNVMREAGGRTVLMDFGAGRENEQARRDLSTAGTPLYMAPEVLDGATATAVSDLYSLGVLLFKLVTRELPVTADSLDELRRAHASGRRRRLRDVRPDLPSSFIKAIEGATATDPAARTGSAADLEHALEAVLNDWTPPTPVPRRDPAARRTLAVRLVAVTAVLALTIGIWNWEVIRDRISPPPPSTAIRSLAVLPFVNLTGQESQEYVADGVTQLLSNHLAELGPLQVISSTSAMTYKRTTKPIATIAKELKVDGIVEGSLSRSGDRVRITVRLVRGSDEHVWGQTYERPAADLFKVQGEIASMVADAVKLSLTAEQRKELTTPSVQAQAQDAFLRGMQRMHDFRAEALNLALNDLREAVRLDPGSARAWATLSQCYLLIGAYAPEIITRAESYKEALAAATHALQLDDSVSEAHTELAEVKFYYEWNWEWARREYERALELNPNNSHAMARYSLFLSALERHDEAIERAREAARLDPLTATVRFVPGMALFYARRYDEAITAFENLADIHPFALGAPDRFALGRTYAAIGNYPRAVEEIQIALKQGGPVPPSPWLAELARVRVYEGNRAAARRLLEQLSANPTVPPANLAFVHAALGDTNRAFHELNRAADQRSPVLLWANVDPRLDNLRPDPRYRDLIARIGLSQ
jgi:serine/threonine protein kinase/tetratricopeptide (TPR) repeat protein